MLAAAGSTRVVPETGPTLVVALPQQALSYFERELIILHQQNMESFRPGRINVP